MRANAESGPRITMGRKRDVSEPRERRSPTATLSNYSDDFMAELNLPAIPDGIPERLAEAVHARVNALLFQLREAKKERYIKVLEVRLVREALSAVLTAHELRLADADVLYAAFRRAVAELGYESVDAGVVKRGPAAEDLP
jgi:hypothetical protein